MIAQLALTAIRSHPALKESLRKGMRAVGYDTTDWVRSVMYESCFDFVRSLDPSRLDVLEISAGPQWVREFRFRRYEPTQFPGFDICAETLPRRYDLIIADQVFEHLQWPYRAGRNVWSMLKPGGHFVVVTPFLVRGPQSSDRLLALDRDGAQLSSPGMWVQGRGHPDPVLGQSKVPESQSDGVA